MDQEPVVLIRKSTPVFASIDAKLEGLMSKDHEALKLLFLTGYHLLWYLEMKLKRKRQCDPALSWADRCEAPSMS